MTRDEQRFLIGKSYFLDDRYTSVYYQDVCAKNNLKKKGLEERFDPSSLFENVHSAQNQTSLTEIEPETQNSQSPIKSKSKCSKCNHAKSIEEENIVRPYYKDIPKRKQNSAIPQNRAPFSVSNLQISEITESSSDYSKTFILSASISTTYVESVITQAFTIDEKISRDKLERIFRQIYLLDPKERIYEYSFLRNKLEQWKTDQCSYSSIQAKDDILAAINGDEKSKFNNFIRKKINTALHNGNFKPYVEKPKPSKQPKKTISYEVYERLINPQPTPRYTCPTQPKDELPPPIMTYKKFENTPKGQLSFFEREDLYLQRAAIERAAIEIERSSTPRPLKRSNPPQYDEKTQEEIDKLVGKKKRQLEALKKGPTFKPIITPFEEYEKLSQIAQNAGEIPGFQRAIKRMVDARDLREFQKQESILPEPPAVKRRKIKPESKSIIVINRNEIETIKKSQQNREQDLEAPHILRDIKDMKSILG